MLAGLAIGVAAGGVLAVAAGTSRTATAYDRLAAAARRYDVSVQDDGDGAPTIARIADLPGVVAYDRLAVYFGLVDGEALLLTGGTEGDFGYRLDTPVLVHGRLPRPTADDEVLLNEEAASSFGLSVGDTVEVATMSPDQFVAVAFEGQPLEGAPAGPTLVLDVVGVGRIPDDLDDPDAASIVPPPVIERLAGEAGGFDNLARVRLEDGTTVDRFTRSLEELPGHRAEQVYVTRGRDDGRRVSDATRVESVSTGLLALASGLALAFVVALVIARSGDDSLPQRALAACGLDRRARALAAGLPLLVIGAVAALTALPVAVALSSFFPIGLAGRAEPDPGIDVDGPILAAGAALVLLVVALSAAWHAWRTSAVTTLGAGPLTRPAPGDGLARRLGLGPPSTFGVRLALSPGRGARTVPARSAIVALAVGVAGVSAVLVFAASLDRLVTTPSFYGVTWDLTVSGSDDRTQNRDLREQLLAAPETEGLVETRVQQVEIRGEDIPVTAVTRHRGDVDAVYLGGRPPRRPDEIALGPLDADDLGVSPGDRLTVPGADGDVVVRVVGTVLVPVEDDEAGRGATMTSDGLARLARSGGFTSFLVDLAPGAEPERVAAQLGAEAERPQTPTSVGNLARAKGVPRLLAAFLAVVGLAAVLHALAVTARRRRPELGTLRALGFRRGQLRSLFLWQALTIAVTGTVLGLALGVAAGRTVWRTVADGLGVVAEPAAATPVLLGGGLLIVAGVAILGAAVGAVAARATVAHPPRQE